MKEGKFYRNFWVSHNRQKISQHEFQPGTFDGRPGLQQVIRNYAGHIRENKILTGLSYDSATNTVTTGVCIVNGVSQDVEGTGAVVIGAGSHIMYNTITSKIEMQDPPFTGIYLASGNGDVKWREKVDGTGVHIGYHTERFYKGDIHSLSLHTGNISNASISSTSITDVTSNVDFNNNQLNNVYSIDNGGSDILISDNVDFNQNQLDNIGSIDGDAGGLNIESITIDGNNISNVGTLDVVTLENGGSDITIDDNLDMNNHNVDDASRIVIRLTGAGDGSIYGGNGTTSDSDDEPPVGVGIGTNQVQIAGLLTNDDWGGTIAGAAGDVAYVTASNTIGNNIAVDATHVKIIGVFTAADTIAVNPSPIVIEVR